MRILVVLLAVLFAGCEMYPTVYLPVRDAGVDAGSDAGADDAPDEVAK